MSPRKPLRTCRGGGGWEEGWGRLRRPRPLPVCAFPLQPGRRKRPHSTPPHSRPYECDDLLPKYLPLKEPPPPLPDASPSPPPSSKPPPPTTPPPPTPHPPPPPLFSSLFFSFSLSCPPLP